jgi:hypothetical protein
MKELLKSIKVFLERTTPLGDLAQRRRQRRGRARPTESRPEEKGRVPLPIPDVLSDTLKTKYTKMFSSYIYRTDYIIIWGHGLKYQDKIIEEIRSHKDLKIIKAIHYRPSTVRQLVKAVYSYDYAPRRHLKSKTRYLTRTPKEALFIFIENRNPGEDFYGKGVFRHFESTTLKQLKERIRNKYNERIDGERTEDHVIHASDNELQTHMILKYLGLGGLRWLKKKHSILEVPFYVKECREFVIKDIPAESLVCNVADGDPENPHKRKCISVKQSPHYLALTGNPDAYQKYVGKFFRRKFTEYYCLDTFEKLADNFEYLAHPYCTHYIAVRQLNDGRYRIIDGLHRAAIMCYKGVSYLTVAVLK